MRFTRRAAFVAGLAAVAVAVAGGVYAAGGSAGKRIVPPVGPKMAVFGDAGRADTSEPELASTFAALSDKPEMARGRVLAQGLGRHGSRLVAFPSASGSTVCYALLGRTPHDPAMSYCFQPLASDLPAPLRGQHFHAAALYSNVDGRVGTQLFGIAFDDVKAMRVDVAGTWRAVPVRHNGFYLDLPNVAQAEVGVVEATLKDGAVQRHDIQTGG
jgi:hypothetical protein